MPFGRQKNVYPVSAQLIMTYVAFCCSQTRLNEKRLWQSCFVKIQNGMNGFVISRFKIISELQDFSVIVDISLGGFLIWLKLKE